MNLEERCIRAALLNRNLTHSSFRLYCAVVILLKGRSQDVTTGISVETLKALLPGVRGKPLGEGALRENLRELLAEKLIEVAGPHWSKVSLQVRLLDPEPPGSHLEDVLLNGPGWVRSSQ